MLHLGAVAVADRCIEALNLQLRGIWNDCWLRVVHLQNESKNNIDQVSIDRPNHRQLELRARKPNADEAGIGRGPRL